MEQAPKPSSSEPFDQEAGQTPLPAYRGPVKGRIIKKWFVRKTSDGTSHDMPVPEGAGEDVPTVNPSEDNTDDGKHQMGEPQLMDDYIDQSIAAWGIGGRSEDNESPAKLPEDEAGGAAGEAEEDLFATNDRHVARQQELTEKAQEIKASRAWVEQIHNIQGKKPPREAWNKYVDEQLEGYRAGNEDLKYEVSKASLAIAAVKESIARSWSSTKVSFSNFIERIRRHRSQEKSSTQPKLGQQEFDIFQENDAYNKPKPKFGLLGRLKKYFERQPESTKSPSGDEQLVLGIFQESQVDNERGNNQGRAEGSRAATRSESSSPKEVIKKLAVRPLRFMKSQTGELMDLSLSILINNDFAEKVMKDFHEGTLAMYKNTETSLKVVKPESADNNAESQTETDVFSRSKREEKRFKKKQDGFIDAVIAEKDGKADAVTKQQEREFAIHVNSEIEKYITVLKKQGMEDDKIEDRVRTQYANVVNKSLTVYSIRAKLTEEGRQQLGESLKETLEEAVDSGVLSSKTGVTDLIKKVILMPASATAQSSAAAA